MKKEKRKFTRKDVPFRCASLKKPGDNLVVSNIVDISEGGIKLFSSVPVNNGESLRLRFSLPGNGSNILDSTARLVWARRAENTSRGEYYLGLKFEHLSHVDRTRIQRFIKSS